MDGIRRKLGREYEGIEMRIGIKIEKRIFFLEKKENFEQKYVMIDNNA